MSMKTYTNIMNIFPYKYTECLYYTSEFSDTCFRWNVSGYSTTVTKIIMFDQHCFACTFYGLIWLHYTFISKSRDTKCDRICDNSLQKILYCIKDLYIQCASYTLCFLFNFLFVFATFSNIFSNNNMSISARVRLKETSAVWYKTWILHWHYVFWLGMA